MFTLWYRILRSFSCHSMNRIWTGTLKVMFTLWYRILRSFSCHSMNRIWTGTLKVMFTLWYRILRSFSCHSMNRIWTGTLKVMFTLWYRILRSFSCHSMNRVWTGTALDRSKSFKHTKASIWVVKFCRLQTDAKTEPSYSSIKGAVSRNLSKCKRRELRPNQVKYENKCSNNY